MVKLILLTAVIFTILVEVTSLPGYIAVSIAIKIVLLSLFMHDIFLNAEYKRQVEGPPGPPGPAGPPGLPGRDGVPGADGKDGDNGPKGAQGEPGERGQSGRVGPPGSRGERGESGPPGNPGPQGPRGLPAPPIDPSQLPNGSIIIQGSPGDPGQPGLAGPQGEQGLDGAPGRPGDDGAPGDRGPAGDPGPAGDSGTPGPQGHPGEPGMDGGGVTYIRWGKQTCPSTAGTELVYAGRAVGSQWSSSGGTSDILCLPENPEYDEDYQSGAQRFSTIHGVEYETFPGAPLGDARDHNVPCAVCHNTRRAGSIMIPARRSCPATWTEEYDGYLVSSYWNSGGRQSAECVDGDPDFVRGEARDTNGALFYHVEAACNGIPCPPYDPQKELTCVVCTK